LLYCQQYNCNTQQICPTSQLLLALLVLLIFCLFPELLQVIQGTDGSSRFSQPDLIPLTQTRALNDSNSNNNNANGTHSFVCKRAPGRTARHHALNDLVARAFGSAGLPVTKEPHGLTQSDGKCPDGLIMVPWKEGKPLTWDVTVVCSLADSYVDASAWDAGLAAEVAALCKIDTVNILPWRELSCSSQSLLNLWAQ